jgi:O-antigen/teichoic acid export membrane protein
LRKVVQDTVTDTVGRVLFPSLNSIRDDEERLRQGFRKAVTLSTFVFSPVMIGLIVVARPLITILFSEKWESCVIFFQLMCAGGLLLPLSMINQDILIVKGRPDLFLRLTLVFRATIIANIVLTYRWGISAMLLGQVVCSLIVCFLYSYYSGRMLGYSTTSQILDILPSFVFSGLMGGGAALVGMALKNTNSFILLVAQSGAGLALYLLLAYLSSRELLFETIGIVKRLPGLLAKS